MAEAQSTGRDTLPKIGRVNEVCREWVVREDGALAYRLQNEEISEHLTGNRYRNAQVREDFPCALDEQLREQHLAEQAAALYHQMIVEQEEQDAIVAKQLAEKIEREEMARKRAIEQEDAEIARQLLEREKLKQEKHRPPDFDSPQRINHFEAPRRQGSLMPLPTQSSSAEIVGDLRRCSINDALELGLPVDEVDERRIQEERDAELARKLQEQESSATHIQLNRDRLMAIEAQDKELAKLLQEKERAKVRRAKERAKQKALAKKQQTELNPDQILPDDSYSNPVDLIHPSENLQINHPHNPHAPNCRVSLQSAQPHEDDVNYSYPVDVLPNKTPYDHNLKQNYSPQKNYDLRLNGYCQRSEIRAAPSGISGEIPAVRPTHLDLKSPINKSVKPRSPDPDLVEIKPDSSYTQHANIAMAIDPTYSRRNLSQTPSSQDTSTISTSTTSSTTSPAISLPPPDLSEDELSPVPPYMPIQGQRRTASLEKKQKKRAKDGCKQQ